MFFLNNFLKKRKLRKIKVKLNYFISLFDPNKFIDRLDAYKEISEFLISGSISVNKISYSELGDVYLDLYFVNSREVINNLKNKTDDTKIRISSDKQLSLWVCNKDDITESIILLNEVLIDAVKYSHFKRKDPLEGFNLNEINELIEWGNALPYWYKTFLNSNKLNYLIVDLFKVLLVFIDIELGGDSNV